MSRAEGRRKFMAANDSLARLEHAEAECMALRAQLHDLNVACAEWKRRAYGGAEGEALRAKLARAVEVLRVYRSSLHVSQFARQHIATVLAEIEEQL